MKTESEIREVLEEGIEHLKELERITDTDVHHEILEQKERIFILKWVLNERVSYRGGCQKLKCESMRKAYDCFNMAKSFGVVPDCENCKGEFTFKISDCEKDALEKKGLDKS